MTEANEEMNNNENILKNKFNKSVNFLEESEKNEQEKEILKRRTFKKKTLRRITLDPPDELGMNEPEAEKVHQKPEELSRSLIFERGDLTSRSLAFDKQKKITFKKTNFSHSNNKVINVDEKKEEKKDIEAYIAKDNKKEAIKDNKDNNKNNGNLEDNFSNKDENEIKNKEENNELDNNYEENKEVDIQFEENEEHNNKNENEIIMMKKMN